MLTPENLTLIEGLAKIAIAMSYCDCESCRDIKRDYRHAVTPVVVLELINDLRAAQLLLEAHRSTTR